MTASDESPGAKALRAAGYEKMPGFWLTRDQRDAVERMARGNLQEILRIKDEAKAKAPRS